MLSLVEGGLRNRIRCFVRNFPVNPGRCHKRPRPMFYCRTIWSVKIILPISSWKDKILWLKNFQHNWPIVI